MTKAIKYFLLLFVAYAGPAISQEKLAAVYPKLPKGIKVSYGVNNPLKQALGAVPESAVFKMNGYYLWDPSVIRVGNTYHLFASRWPSSEGMNGWRKSEVIRATSPSLFGPYQFQQVVLSPKTHPWATQATHNPKIIKAGNQYLLYHLGIPQWKTGFAFAVSVEGPWKPVNHPVIPTNNPAMLIRPGGSVYVVGKFKPKLTKDGTWDDYMQAFEAQSIEGPYKLVKDSLNRLPGDLELEDPTIWWANNQYNVICTDWEGKVTGINKAIVYYTSKDGIIYQLYSQIPVWSQAEPVPMADGSQFSVAGIERPQVFTDEKGAVTALLVSVHPSKNEPTYIIIRPVKKFTPAN